VFEDWVWIPAFGVVLIGVAVLAYKTMFEPQHLAYDAGDGTIKVDCPEDTEVRRVYMAACSTFPCPNCGQKLAWPKQKLQWCRVEP
jgi:ribosomal protein S27E